VVLPADFVTAMMLRLGALWLMAALPAVGALEWETREARIEVPYGSELVEVEFRFVNRGAVPVEIERVWSSCDCAAALETARRVEPGETGSIRVSYAPGDRVGERRASVWVAGRDGKPFTEQLTLIASMPQPIRLSPRALVWGRGGAAEWRVVEVAIDPEGPLSLAGPPGAVEGWDSRLTAVEPGLWKLEIRPLDTDHPRRAVFVLPVGHVAENPRQYSIFAVVR
jgi:hypothetical protein